MPPLYRSSSKFCTLAVKTQPVKVKISTNCWTEAFAKTLRCKITMISVLRGSSCNPFQAYQSALKT